MFLSFWQFTIKKESWIILEKSIKYLLDIINPISTDNFFPFPFILIVFQLRRNKKLRRCQQCKDWLLHRLLMKTNLMKKMMRGLLYLVLEDSITTSYFLVQVQTRFTLIPCWFLCRFLSQNKRNRVNNSQSHNRSISRVSNQ